MAIVRIGLKNFRLFNEVSFDFEPGINLIVGKNGAGKSSLLEAINLAYSKKSHRTSNLLDCLNIHSKVLMIKLEDKVSEALMNMEVSKSRDARIAFKKTLLGSPVSYALNKLNPYVINDGSFKLIEGEPELRRDFLNALLFHVKPLEKKNYLSYTKALKQRNKALKENKNKEEIDLWSNAIVKHGVILGREQGLLFRDLKSFIENKVEIEANRHNLSFLKDFTMAFSWGWNKGSSLEQEVNKSFAKDMATGRTSVGPHRSDISFKIKNQIASKILSRGQVKLLILLIFLVIQLYLEQACKTRSLIMVDDMGSELDADNLNIALKLMSEQNKQVIITSTGSGQIDKLTSKSFNFNKISL